MKLKLQGKQLQETVIFGAAMVPITEFPAKTERDSDKQKTNDAGVPLYSAPNLMALDVAAQRPMRSVFVSLTAPDKQQPIKPAVFYAPAGDVVLNTYAIDGRETITVECSHLVPVNAGGADDVKSN